MIHKENKQSLHIRKLALPLMLMATSFISIAQSSQVDLENEKAAFMQSTAPFVQRIADQITQINDGSLLASMIVKPDPLTQVTNGGMTIGHSIFFLAGYNEQGKPDFWAADFNGGKEFWNIGYIHTGTIRTIDDQNRELMGDLKALGSQWSYAHNAQWLVSRDTAKNIKKEILWEQENRPLFNLGCIPLGYFVWHPWNPIPELRWQESYNCCKWAVKNLWKCGLDVSIPAVGYVPEVVRIHNYRQ